MDRCPLATLLGVWAASRVLTQSPNQVMVEKLVFMGIESVAEGGFRCHAVDREQLRMATDVSQASGEIQSERGML